MPEWLQALQQRSREGRPSILVTVVDAQGSTPRAAGARMAITKNHQFDTIGGGHLEWRAIEIARATLQRPDAEAAFLQRFPLGPSLGQCCGGAVQLLFERIDADTANTEMLAALVSAWEQGRDIWRMVPLAARSRALVIDAAAVPSLAPKTPVSAVSEAQTHIAPDPAGQPCVYDYCRAARPQVILFGAGHVGRAIAALLGGLPCRLLWVDQREEFFPARMPPNVTIEVAEHPEDIVRDAAGGSYYLVMTHSHAVDQLLSERILRREDAAWFGLIGSKTKRGLFLKRLALRGLSENQLSAMTCPIGVDGIGGKEPAMIAIAVTAQLLRLWEQADQA